MHQYPKTIWISITKCRDGKRINFYNSEPIPDENRDGRIWAEWLGFIDCYDCPHEIGTRFELTMPEVSDE